MKKKLWVTLPLIALGGTAFAQSSVTLFGTVDEAVTYIRGDDNWSGLQSGGNMDSFIGFRGTEDLGSGLKAQFWLESGIRADSGSGESDGGLDFKRRATVGLLGNFGEIHLGRAETATYRTMKRFDVFNNAGIGGSQMFTDGFNTGDAATNELAPLGYSKRKDNLVSYTSPRWGGFGFAADYGFGESREKTLKRGAYGSLALTYDQGPWSAALAAEQQNNTSLPTLNSPFDYRQRAYTAGLGYDFERFKVTGAYRRSDIKPDGADSLSGDTYMIGIAAPVGAAGVIKASYNRYEHETFTQGDLKADQISLGYEHNLSKRTALYGTYSYLKNKSRDGANLGLSLGNVQQDEKGKQHGIQLGVRHTF